MKPRLSRALIALAAAGACIGGSANAFALGRMADISVVDRDTGATLPIYTARGQYWIAGTPGHRYSIAVHNRTGNRVLTVMAVDGVNVVTGETAAWQQDGYVFAAGERDEIHGWRKSQSEIAAFEFTSLGDSYAARTGRPNDVGVIGVALFRERIEPRIAAPVLRERGEMSNPVAAPDTQPAPSAKKAPAASPSPADNAPASVLGEVRAAPRAADKLGTGHGAREESWTEYTSFERAHDHPDEVVVLHYDSRENLIAMGVIPMHPMPPQPNPFPGERNGFVPDPPAWR